MIILLKAIYAVSMPDANLIKLYQDANTGEAILAGFLPQLYMGAGIVDWSASVTEWKKDKAGLLKKNCLLGESVWSVASVGSDITARRNSVY
ncbi:hypothetical protein TOC8171_18680 [Pseudomonas syringae]